MTWLGLTLVCTWPPVPNEGSSEPGARVVALAAAGAAQSAATAMRIASVMRLLRVISFLL